MVSLGARITEFFARERFIDHNRVGVLHCWVAVTILSSIGPRYLTLFSIALTIRRKAIVYFQIEYSPYREWPRKPVWQWPQRGWVDIPEAVCVPGPAWQVTVYLWNFKRRFGV